MTGYLVSCEHAGNQIPPAYQAFFQDADDQALLDSHRGYDAGALLMAQDLAARLKAPLVSASVSRLLVDLNRSIHNPQVFSPKLRRAPAELRRQIAEQYHRPYRAEALALVREGIEREGRVVHVSCHSFTPQLRGVVRNCDIGLLYDSRRHCEAELCRSWQSAIADAGKLIVRRNYPYEGKNDGLTTSLRKCFSAEDYLGIELEINQKHVLDADAGWLSLRALLCESLRVVLEGRFADRT